MPVQSDAPAPMLTLAVEPPPAAASTPTGETRAPWSYWRIPFCGERLVVQCHRSGAHRLSGERCGTSGCRRCHSGRRRRAMSGLDGLQPTRGWAYYMWTFTPPARVLSWESRDRWLSQVRATLKAAVEEGVLAGAYVVVEGPGCGEASWQRCPARLRWWEERGEVIEETGRAWEDACIRGECAICCDSPRAGWLEASHLHAHVVAVARPCWWGRDAAPDAARRRGFGDIELQLQPGVSWEVKASGRIVVQSCVPGVKSDNGGRVRHEQPRWTLHHAGGRVAEPADAPPRPGRGRARYLQTWRGRHGPSPLHARSRRGSARRPVSPTNVRCHGTDYKVTAGWSPPNRVGLWGWMEAHGHPVSDFQAVKSKDAVKTYLSKLVKDYLSKVSKDGSGEADDAMLLGAWLAGRHSSWAMGDVCGLTGADTRSLSWEYEDTVDASVGETAYRSVAPPSVWLGPCYVDADSPFGGAAECGCPRHARLQPPAYVEPTGGEVDEKVIVRRYTAAWARVVAGEHPLGLFPGRKWVRVSQGQVLRVGSEVAAWVVGGSVVGEPGTRRGQVRAVMRAYRRWSSGKIQGEWAEWWKGAARVLGLPPLPFWHGWHVPPGGADASPVAPPAEGVDERAAWGAAVWMVDDAYAPARGGEAHASRVWGAEERRRPLPPPPPAVPPQAAGNPDRLTLWPALFGPPVWVPHPRPPPGGATPPPT